ncbi:MAG: type II/IV secretion system protein, partial [Verrucomicrobiota bacterium]
MATNEDYAIEILLDTGLITKSQLTRAREDTPQGEKVVDALIKNEIVTQEDVTRALAAHASMDFVDLSQMAISQEVIAMIPPELARRYKVVPISQQDASLMVAIGDPLNFDTFDSLSFLLKRDVEFVCASPDSIKTALVKYYG